MNLIKANAGLVLTLVVGLLLVFWIPTLFPPPLASSESYLFGFNNRLCELIFGVLVFTVAVLVKNSGIVLSPSRRDLHASAPGLTPRLLAVCMGTSAVLCGAMYWLVRPLGGINDGAYFLDRIHLAMRGQRAFQDFEFIYGSGPLYTSVILGRLLRTSADNGYYLLWFAETLLGVLLLWLSLRWVELPAAGKRTVFLLYYVSLSMYIPLATLNYCGFRYTLPIFAITALCRLDRNSRAMTRVQVILFAVALTAVLLLSSPEEGIVYALAVFLYLPARRYYEQRPFVPDIVALTGALAILYLMASRAGTFTTMKVLGAGAFNLPVYAGLHVWIAFASILGMVCYLATGEAGERIRSDVALLVLYSLGMLPGAMGRCDPTHVSGYLLTVICCAMLLSWRWICVWRVAIISFGTCFIALPLIISLWMQPPVLSKALLNRLYMGGPPRNLLGTTLDSLGTRLAVHLLGEQRARAKLAALRNASIQGSVDPHIVFPGASSTVAVPFEYHPNKISNYQSPGVSEGYFMGMTNVLTPGEVEQKIRELRSRPDEDLVLSPEGLQECEVRRGDRAALRALLLVPWVPQPRQELRMYVPLCDYIHEQYQIFYQPSPETFGYGLMRHKDQK